MKKSDHYKNSKRITKIVVVLFLLFMALALFYFGWSTYDAKQKTSPVNFTIPAPPVQSTPIAEEDLGNPNDVSLEIPALGITAPINNVDCASYQQYMNMLNQGLIHCLNTGNPGEIGNTFIAGHSSSDTRSEFENIFSTLPDIPDDALINIYLGKKKITYQVSQELIVKDTDVFVMNPSNQVELTLMTCWPVGTSDKRYIVKAYLVPEPV